MNIALVTLSFWPVVGGMETVVHDLATALGDLGHGVTVFAPKQRHRFEEIEHRYQLVRFGWTFRGGFRSGINRFPLARVFGKLHAFNRFDVINGHSAYLATSYSLALKRKFGVPVVVTCHGHDIQRYPGIGYGLRLSPAKDRLIGRNLDAADLTVSISRSIDEELRELLPAGKIVSIPNGVPIPTGGERTDAWLRPRLGETAAVVVISVGRNVPKKSLDTGLRAFALAAADVPGVRYVHIGRDGELLERLAADLGVADRFSALGEQPRARVLQAYREADIFFSPAAVEAAPLVAIEAMAAGLPCLVSDGPGNRDAVEHGGNGLMVPVGDIDAMAAAMVSLMRDEDKRRRFGAASREMVARFAWPVVAAEYANAFQDLISRAARAGDAP